MGAAIILKDDGDGLSFKEFFFGEDFNPAIHSHQLVREMYDRLCATLEQSGSVQDVEMNQPASDDSVIHEQRRPLIVVPGSSRLQ